MIEIPVTRDNPQMNRGESSADYCRRKGWGPGTRVVGNEGYGPTVIEITAVGHSNILAGRIITRHGEELLDRESSWTLRFRDWQEVPRE